MNPLWVLSRATGLVSLVLLTLVMVIGILVQRQRRVGTLPRFVVVGLHRNASLLGVAFVAVHVASVVYDPYVSIRWVDALVPFAGSYRPFWLGLGAVTLDLMLALVLTSLLRHRVPRRAWRAVHWAAYACWPVALAHGVGTGSDMTGRLGLGVAAACTATVAVAALWRIAAPTPTAPQQRAARLMAELRATSHSGRTKVGR
jgi:sulfoxide reductase heme-binding subunit YedZ